jgi:hypothetical protein
LYGVTLFSRNIDNKEVCQAYEHLTTAVQMHQKEEKNQKNQNIKLHRHVVVFFKGVSMPTTHTQNPLVATNKTPLKKNKGKTGTTPDARYVISKEMSSTSGFSLELRLTSFKKDPPSGTFLP